MPEIPPSHRDLLDLAVPYRDRRVIVTIKPTRVNAVDMRG